MYHSIYFGEKNTWDDWHLVPETRPVINPPEVKTNYIDIPGGNGALDLTEALSGYPFYNNREGSIDFIVVNDMYYQVDEHEEWYVKYSEIMNYLHGQKMIMILEDDKQYYYIGRFAVNEWKSDKNFSRITIDYNVEPYKWNIFSTLDDWLWDPFNFITGVIPSNFRDINVPTWNFNDSTHKIETNWQTLYLSRTDIGYAPVSPTIYAQFQESEILVRRIGGKRQEPALLFKIPGYEQPRAYSYKLLKDGVQIPELTFRNTQDEEDLKIEYATRQTKTVSRNKQLTCSNCSRTYNIMNLTVSYGDDTYTFACPNCHHANTYNQYDEDTAVMNVEVREGRL